MQHRFRRRLDLVVSGSLLLTLSSCLFGGNDEKKATMSVCTKDSLVDIPMAAKVADPEEEIARLGQRILVLSEQHDAADTSVRAAILDEIKRQIITRSEILAERIADHPGEVLRTEIPRTLRRNIPEEARSCLERRVYKSGTVRVTAADTLLPTDHRIDFFFLADDGSSYSLHFAEKLPDLQSGNRIRIRGIELPCESGSIRSIAMLDESQALLELTDTAAIAPRIFGAQNTAAILLNFSDKPANSSRDDVQNVVFSQVSDYLRETSSGQTWLTGQVLGPYTIGVSSGSCDAWAISGAAKAAANAAGVNLSQYSRLIYVFPKNSCGWLGLGTIGGLQSESWINNSLVLHTVAHELGHNFGLYHANALNCGYSASIGSSCSNIEYGDTTDIMGNRVAGHYSAFHKERLGWLNYGISPTITTVDSTGAYWLPPYESSGSESKALKVLKSIDSSNSSKNYYYLEYRQPLGFDEIFARLVNVNNLTRGLVLHTGNSANANTSYLLNMNPQTGSFFQAALNIGQSFLDPSTLTRVSLLSADATGASVQIDLGNGRPGCEKSSPSLILSPVRSDWVASGTKVTFTAVIRNLDSETCAVPDLDLSLEAPTGWAISSSTARLQITPQNSANAVIEMTSTVASMAGSYEMKARINRNDGPSDTAARAYYFVLPQQGAIVVATTERASYLRGESIDLRVDAAADGSVAANADYILRVIQPNGSSLTRVGKTDSHGSATRSFQAGECAIRGVYRVHVDLKAPDGSVVSHDSSFELR